MDFSFFFILLQYKRAPLLPAPPRKSASISRLHRCRSHILLSGLEAGAMFGQTGATKYDYYSPWSGKCSSGSNSVHLSGGKVSDTGPRHRAVCADEPGLSWRVTPKTEDVTKLLPLRSTNPERDDLPQRSSTPHTSVITNNTNDNGLSHLIPKPTIRTITLKSHQNNKD